MKNTGTTCSNSNVDSHKTKTLLIGDRKIIWYDLDTTTSTMDNALRMVKEGSMPWTVVSADNQTSGRGTHGRTWFSPKGRGLWISIILPPPHKAEYLSNLSVLAARALIKCFNEFKELHFEIKPPNDVIVNGRKIAGILFESITSGEDVSSVVLGMGVNLLQNAEDFENEGLPDATSFFIETGVVLNRDSFMRSFIENFKPMYEKSVLEK